MKGRILKALIFSLVFLLIFGLSGVYGKDFKDILKNKCVSGVQDFYQNPQKYESTKDIENACRRYLELENDKNSDDYAYVNMLLGVLYYSKGEYDKAEEYYFKAKDIYEKIYKNKIHPDLASTYLNLGLLYADKGKYDKAEVYYLKAKDIFEKIYKNKNHPDLASTYLNLGLLYAKKGKYDKAEVYYLKALRIREKILDKNHPDLASTYLNLGVLYADKGKYDKAEVYFLKALSIVEDIYTFLNFSDLKTQKKFLDNIYKRFKVVFYLTDKIKDESFTKKLFNYWVNYKNSILTYNMLINLAKEIPELKETLSDLRFINIQIANIEKSLYKSQNLDDRKIKYLKTELGKLKEKRRKLQAKVKLELEKHQLYDKVRFVRFNDIKHFLSKDTLYIDFAYFENEIYYTSIYGIEVPAQFEVGNYYAFTVDKKGNIKLYFIGNADEIDRTIDKFREAVKDLTVATKQNRKDINLYIKNLKKVSSELYQTLFSGIEEIKNYNNLVISPHGYLVFIPFEALYNPKTKKYLVEEKNISYIPTAKAFTLLNRENQRYRKVFVFAKSKFKNSRFINDENLNKPVSKFGRSYTKIDLPFTIDEKKYIEEILKDRYKVIPFTDREATFDRFTKIKEAKYIHIATHGVFDEKAENPLNQFYLVLDKPVYPRDVLSMDLKGTDLVFLSACETGKIEDIKHLTFSGMIEAFYVAGAKDVIITLWEISDKATTELVKEFYKNLKTGESVKEALTEAKRKFIKQNKNPYYWMPFLLYGL